VRYDIYMCVCIYIYVYIHVVYIYIYDIRRQMVFNSRLTHCAGLKFPPGVRSLFFWNVTHRGLLINYRRFGARSEKLFRNAGR
jgi:hypothetical protein